MATAIAAAEKPTALDRFRMEILPPERKSDLFKSLPAHVRPEVFERNLVNALMQNPDLMALEARLVFREVSKAAALGLYLDPQLGEAYLIAGWNGKTKKKEPQLRIGYRGLVKLGRQSGEITMIYAHEVCQHDAFRCVMGDHKTLQHEPDVFGERGPIVGYYAVVKYKDGETDFEPMSVSQVHGIRDRSDGWKAYKEGKIRSTPWSTDEVEMGKKTAIRRLVKRIPQSPELADAIRIEDEAEQIVDTGRAGAVPMPPPAPKLVSISAPPAEAETIASQGDAPAGEGDAAEAANQEEGPQVLPECPGTSDGEAFVKWTDAVLKTADKLEALEPLFNAEIEPRMEGLIPPDREEVFATFKRHEKRLGGD